MAEPCFVKKNPAPPVFGVRNVPRVPHQSTDYLASSRLEDFTVLVCPKGGQVINDETGRKIGRPY